MPDNDNETKDSGPHAFGSMDEIITESVFATPPEPSEPVEVPVPLERPIFITQPHTMMAPRRPVFIDRSDKELPPPPVAPSNTPEDLAMLAILRARYFDPTISGAERERRIRPMIARHIIVDALGTETYSWPEGLDMRGIPDPKPHHQLQLFGRGLQRG